MATVYRNGRLYARGGLASGSTTALGVDGDLIAWVGDEDSAARLTASTDRVVDLHGAFLAPAFVDAHVHATLTGLALTGLELRAATSLPAALALVEASARATRGRPILGSGWDDTGWPERRPPSAAELDRAGYGGSVYLARVDAHSCVASSALMSSVPRLSQLAGFRADGWLTGAAHDAVRVAALSGVTAGQRADAQRAALRHAAGLGIACVHEMAGPVISSADDLAALLALRDEEPLPEVVGYWAELRGVHTARELGAVGAAGDLFCDGSLGSRTAALSQPYADAPHSRGSLRHEVGELAEHIVSCARAGLQAGFHAIGDAAVDQALDAFELAGRQLGRPAGPGSRLEHVEFLRDAQRFAGSGLLASTQPVFDALWGGPTGMYAQRLGVERAAQLNRFADLASAGVPLAFGSDAPVTSLGPWEAIRAAAHPSDPLAAISPRAAFAAHTRGGWRAGGSGGEDGVLAAGAPATFAIWAAGEVAVDAPDERVARWSTDERAAVPGLPDVAPGVDLPTCLATVLRGAVIHDTGLLHN